jgi:hypothetical protein
LLTILQHSFKIGQEVIHLFFCLPHSNRHINHSNYKLCSDVITHVKCSLTRSDGDSNQIPTQLRGYSLHKPHSLYRRDVSHPKHYLGHVIGWIEPPLPESHWMPGQRKDLISGSRSVPHHASARCGESIPGPNRHRLHGWNDLSFQLSAGHCSKWHEVPLLQMIIRSTRWQPFV